MRNPANKKVIPRPPILPILPILPALSGAERVSIIFLLCLFVEFDKITGLYFVRNVYLILAKHENWKRYGYGSY